MGISVNTSPQQITASVGETQIDVTVSGGIGPSGAVGGGYTLPTATASVLGGVKIGSGISIDGSGVISASSGYTLPTATSSVLGGVKIGSGVTITDGVISVSTSYAAASHTHAISDVTGLASTLSGIDTAISGKADAADFDQGLKTTDNVEFGELTVTGDLIFPGTNQGSLLFIGNASGVTYRQIGTAGQVLIVNAGATAPEWKTLAAADIGAAAVSHAHSATSDLTFAGATAGQVLTVNSGATALVWATPATYTLPDATNSVKGGITVSTGLSVASGALSVSYGTSSGTACQGNDSRLHDRSHAITSTSDHTATAWRTFYSDSGGNVTELALGASGTVLTSGGASAAPSFAALPAGGTKTLARFTPEMNQPPSTAYATFDTRNSILVLEFDAATQESAVFCGVIPESSTFASGLIVRIWWMGDTATSGNVRWGVSFEKTGTDNDSDSFDTVTQAHSAASSTSGIEMVTSITATAIDSLAAGDRFRLKVTRIADDATNDTMTGDAQLVAVEVQAA